MTYDPNDVNRPLADDTLAPRTDATGTYRRPPSNTGVIGAIIGVLAVVAVVFFVWRGYEGNDSMTTGSTTNNAAATSTASPAPKPAPAPAAPATPAPAPATPKAP